MRSLLLSLAAFSGAAVAAQCPLVSVFEKACSDSYVQDDTQYYLQNCNIGINIITPLKTRAEDSSAGCVAQCTQSANCDLVTYDATTLGCSLFKIPTDSDASQIINLTGTLRAWLKLGFNPCPTTSTTTSSASTTSSSSTTTTSSSSTSTSSSSSSSSSSTTESTTSSSTTESSTSSSTTDTTTTTEEYTTTTTSTQEYTTTTTSSWTYDTTTTTSWYSSTPSPPPGWHEWDDEDGSKPSTWDDWKQHGEPTGKPKPPPGWNEWETSKGPKPSTWDDWKHTPATTTGNWETWSPDTTVTVITTSYVDVCPTGYTTVALTTTITVKVHQHGKPTDKPEDDDEEYIWPTDASGCPSGFYTATAYCPRGCAAWPTTVIVTLPVTETASGTWDAWQASKTTAAPSIQWAAYTGAPPTTAEPTSTIVWNTWDWKAWTSSMKEGENAQPSAMVKVYHGGAATTRVGYGVVGAVVVGMLGLMVV